MAEMVYTEYRLLGAQLQAGRMLAAVKTSRRLTDLIDSPQDLATPMDSRIDGTDTPPAGKPARHRQPETRRRTIGMTPGMYRHLHSYTCYS